LDEATQGFPRQLDIDGSGQALLVWTDGDGSDIKGSEFDGSSWSTPVLLADEASTVSVEVLAVSKSLINGKAVFSYVADNTTDYLKASTYDGSVWSPLSTLLSGALLFNGLDMNVQGEALDLGVTPDTGVANVQSSFFNGSNFEAATVVDVFGLNASILSSQSISTGDYPLRLPKTYAVWYNDNDVVMGEFDETTKTWNSAFNTWSVIDSETMAYVATNGLGQIIVAWADQSKTGIRFDYYDGTSWAGPGWVVQGISAGLTNLTVGIDESGIPYVIGNTPPNSNNSSAQVVSGVYNPGTDTWTTTVLQTRADNKERIGESTLAVHPNGTALAVWAFRAENASNSYSLRYSIYTPGSGWSTAEELVDLETSSFDINAPRAAISRDGTAVVAWHDLDSESDEQVYSIWDRAFTTKAVPVPPQGFEGAAYKNSFPNETEYFHALEWEESIDPVVVSYKLYRNGKAIATTPLGTPKYVVHNVDKKDKVTYTLTTVNGDGAESTPVTLILP